MNFSLKAPINQALIKLFRLPSIVPPSGSAGDQKDALGKALDGALADSGMQSAMMSAYGAYMATEVDRIRQYKEYDMMDEESEVITTALDIYMEDASAFDAFVGARIWVTAQDDELAQDINDWLKKIKVEANAPRIMRNLAKYGDFFLRTMGKVKKENEEKGGGVFATDTSYWPGDVFPVVKKRKLLGYVVVNNQLQQQSSDECLFAPWQFVHFAVPGDSNFYRLDQMMNYQNLKREDMVEYGQSLLKAARRPHKRSKLMHDILAISRLTRSPLKRIFKFLTETSNPVKAIQDLAIFKKTMEKIGGVDVVNGDLSYEEMLNVITQDIYLPIMKESKGDFSIDTIGGDVDVEKLADIELFDNRLFMSLRIPKEQLNFGANTGNDGANLRDTRYAKRINRVQAAFRTGVRDLIFIHYAMKGKVLKESDFDVNMASTSISEDLNRLDYYGNAVQTADAFVRMLGAFEEGETFQVVSGKMATEESRKHEADDEPPADELGTEPEAAVGGEPDAEPAKVPEPKKEALNKGYLIYYIMKHVIKFPGFDIKAYYPGATQYENENRKNERTHRLIESNKLWIEHYFKQNFQKDLKEAAEELNSGIEREYRNQPIPENFTFDQESLRGYFEEMIALKEKEAKEKRRR
jgi:hypothetical protein